MRTLIGRRVRVCVTIRSPRDQPCTADRARVVLCNEAMRMGLEIIALPASMRYDTIRDAILTRAQKPT